MNETLRYSLDSLKRASELGYPWSVSPEEARVLIENGEALLAENIALRAQIQMLQEHRESCVASLLKGYETGKLEERAAVVAYLRVEADAFERTRTEHGALRAKWLYLTADAIDRGAHCDLKDEKTPMSYDWTKEELLQELQERKAEGESEEMTFDFIWAVVERAYQERDHCKGEAKTDDQ